MLCYIMSVVFFMVFFMECMLFDKHSSAYLGMATFVVLWRKSVTKRSPHYSAMEQQSQKLIAWLNSPIFVLCVNVF